MSTSSGHTTRMVLMTGGSGTLGTDLRKHFGKRTRLLADVKVLAPSSVEFDVSDYSKMETYFLEQRARYEQRGSQAVSSSYPAPATEMIAPTASEKTTFTTDRSSQEEINGGAPREEHDTEASASGAPSPSSSPTNKNVKIETIVHLAAYVSTVNMKDPEKIAKGIDTNVIGTANVCKLALKYDLQVVYISTDYVFDGKKPGGMYTETDPTFPLNNYGWSKLGGECVVQMLPRFVIIRCPFGPNVFPYPKAFVDQFTSRQPVKTASRDVAKMLELIFADKVKYRGVIHIAGDRKSVYDYAKQDAQGAENVGKLERKDVPEVTLAEDCSLDCSLFKDVLWRQRDAWISDPSPRDA
ncbi:unnamed protein product [Amoebophrya sp. A120]|nr:unnamed protein product [Amoebophrya sp. A120]|eukprot:GSA120T00006663001.1